MVPLYKIVDTEQRYLTRGLIRQQPYAIKTTYNCLMNRVVIPRCGKCAKAHAKAHAVEYGTAITGLIGVLITIVLIVIALSGNVKIIVPIVCGLFTAVLLYASVKAPKYCERGILPESNKVIHLEVKDLYGLGYHLGTGPTDRS